MAVLPASRVAAPTANGTDSRLKICTTLLQSSGPAGQRATCRNRGTARGPTHDEPGCAPPLPVFVEIRLRRATIVAELSTQFRPLSRVSGSISAGISVGRVEVHRTLRPARLDRPMEACNVGRLAGPWNSPC